MGTPLLARDRNEMNGRDGSGNNKSASVNRDANCADDAHGTLPDFWVKVAAFATKISHFSEEEADQIGCVVKDRLLLKE